MECTVTRAGKAKDEDSSEFFDRLLRRVDLSSRLEDDIKDEESFWVIKLADISCLLGSFAKPDVKAQIQGDLWVESLSEWAAIDI